MPWRPFHTTLIKRLIMVPAYLLAVGRKAMGKIFPAKQEVEIALYIYVYIHKTLGLSK